MPFFRLLSRVLSVVAGLALLSQQTATAAPPVAVPNLAPLLGPAPIHVAGNDAPPGCSYAYYANSNSTPQPINDFLPITSTINISGVHQPVWSVQVQTQISHTYNNDLEVVLVAPDGRRNVLTTRNGGEYDNAFANTVWTDSATQSVAEVVFSGNGSRPALIPEGAMGAFAGHAANGDWHLVITDTAINDTGMLNGWSLSLVTLNERFQKFQNASANNNDYTINDHSTVTSTITFIGYDPYVMNLHVATEILHTSSSDLTVMLTAPNGLTTTLTEGNGGHTTNTFDGVNFYDAAPVPVSDALYVDHEPLEEAQPEGALAHFLGLDPNGTWTLSVTDDTTGDTGTLDRWAMIFDTGYCTPVRLPLVTR